MTPTKLNLSGRPQTDSTAHNYTSEGHQEGGWDDVSQRGWAQGGDRIFCWKHRRLPTDHYAPQLFPNGGTDQHYNKNIFSNTINFPSHHSQDGKRIENIGHIISCDNSGNIPHSTTSAHCCKQDKAGDLTKEHHTQVGHKEERRKNNNLFSSMVPSSSFLDRAESKCTLLTNNHNGFRPLNFVYRNFRQDLLAGKSYLDTSYQVDRQYSHPLEQGQDVASSPQVRDDHRDNYWVQGFELDDFVVEVESEERNEGHGLYVRYASYFR